MIVQIVIISFLAIMTDAKLSEVKSKPLGDGPETFCMMEHCILQIIACRKDQECWEILNCMKNCEKETTSGTCVFDCDIERISNDSPYQTLMKCSVDHHCMPEQPINGKCLAEDSEAIQSITDLEPLSGDWWVLKGQNCGQDDLWKGGFDWFPCQHNRFTKTDNNHWIANVTFCGGSNSTCQNDKYYNVLPDIYITNPGVVRNDYPIGQAPLVPQVEDWKFISMPNKEWAFVIWCGTNPVLNYGGAFVISRHRSLDTMPADVEAEFNQVASRFGLEYAQMCVSDNTNCAA